MASTDESIIKRAVELNDASLAKHAIAIIDELLRSASDTNNKVYLLFSKASCYRILGKFDEARRQLDAALREKPDDEQTRIAFDLMHALIYQQAGDYKEAFDALSAMLSVHHEQLGSSELHSIYEDIQERRGFLLVTLSRFNEAIPVLLEVANFDVEDHLRSDAFASLGLCYLKVRDYTLARDYLSRAVTIGLTTRWQGEAHFYLGIAYFYIDMLPEAKREFQLCEKLAAQHSLPIIDVYKWLANILSRLGDISASEHYAKLAKRN